MLVFLFLTELHGFENYKSSMIWEHFDALVWLRFACFSVVDDYKNTHLQCVMLIEHMTHCVMCFLQRNPTAVNCVIDHKEQTGLITD